MSLPVRPRLGSLLTLGFCLLAMACARRPAPTPHPPTPEPTPPANLLIDPEFARDTSAWQAGGDPASPVALGWDLAGFATLAVTPAPAPCSAGWSQTVPVQGGASYRASYRGRSDGLAGYADLRLAFYDAAGTLLWQTGGVPLSGDAAWETLSWRCRAPAGAVRAVASLGVTGGKGGRAAFAEAFLGPDDAPPVRALIVDYGRVAGKVRSLAGLDSRLLSWAEGGPSPAVAVPIDLALAFPNPGADPAEAASYDLRAADEALAAAARSGAEMAVQLLEGRREGGARLSPERWAAVTLHLARHYNEAWATGYRYGIRRWELVGAGEVPAAEEYARLAAMIAAFGAHDPALLVGGPAAPAGDPGHLEGLLAYLAERGVRPGFVSWRSDYDGAPQGLALAQARVERLLERYGLDGTEVVVSGWAPAPGADDALYQAAHLVATVACWQEGRLSQAYLRGDEGALAGPVGEAWRRLAGLESTPLRLLGQGQDPLGLALLAGRSEDGEEVLVAIADTGSSSREYRLALAGFPPGYRYTVYEIARQGGTQVVATGDEESLAGGILVVPWQAPAVHWIEVTWAP